MNDIKKAIWHKRFYDAKQTLKNGAEVTLKWVVDNKELIIVMVPVVISGVAEVRRIGDRIESKAEINRKKREIYNPSIHKNVTLKRKLSANQQREITRRQNAGENISNILVSMNLV